MPERKGRSKEQSLWLVLVWVVTLAAMVGLGVLLGKYVLSYCASSLQAPRSSLPATTGTGSLGSSDSGSGAGAVSPISPKSQEDQGAIPSGKPTYDAPDRADNTLASGGIAEESVLYRVQVGEFYDRSEAEKLGRKLEEAGYPVFITQVIPYRIQVGAFQNKANADALATEIEAKGYSVIVQR
ncbi:MAG: SPOR domain-containing protein [Firmicutes bacterium]|nr:SPOR domain-containing protein [Bacillota bacterium]HXL04460.1 SPOR domain-containing protein [Bacillota bacterium]